MDVTDLDLETQLLAGLPIVNAFYALQLSRLNHVMDNESTTQTPWSGRASGLEFR